MKLPWRKDRVSAAHWLKGVTRTTFCYITCSGIVAKYAFLSYSFTSAYDFSRNQGEPAIYLSLQFVRMSRDEADLKLTISQLSPDHVITALL